jgi:uncharacterized membrane protein YqjE
LPKAAERAMPLPFGQSTAASRRGAVILPRIQAVSAERGARMLQAFEFGTSILAQSQMSDEDAAIAAGILGAGLAIILLSLLLVLVVSAIVTWLVWDAYRVLPASEQKLPANLLWLGLIPCLGLIMQLLMGILVPLAFKDAFAARGRTDVGDCGLAIGICWVACSIGSVMPFIGALLGIASIVCMILFIVKVRQLKGVWQSMDPAPSAPTWG